MGFTRTLSPATLVTTVLLLVTVHGAGQQVINRRPSGRVQPFAAAPEPTVLFAADGLPNDAFGSAVAIAGDLLVAGAYADDHDGDTNAGSAYVFRRTGGAWSDGEKVVPADSEAGDTFGFRVATNGSVVFVAAPEKTVNQIEGAGAVYVFTFDHDTQTWIEGARLVSNEPGANDFFGGGLAAADDTLIVGAVRAGDEGPPASGRCFVFRGQDDQWALDQVLSPSAPVSGEFFGSALALDGDTLAIGSIAWHDDTIYGIGKVHIFQLIGGQWVETGQISAPTVGGDPQPHANFGGPIALNNNTLLVGTNRYDVTMNNETFADAGAVVFYPRDGAEFGEPVLQHAEEPEPYHYWGYDVALAGNSAFVGGPSATVDSLGHAGLVDVFHHIGTEWQVQENPITAQEPASTANFGWALSASGNTLAVGAPIDDTDVAHNTGAVHVVPVAAMPRSESEKTGPIELVPRLNPSFAWQQE
jgi:hypothetical protein